MSIEGLGTSRRVSLEEARVIAVRNNTVSIVWRPEESLPEENQFALIYNE